MIAIENHARLPSLVFEKQDPEGEALDVLVVRGTFDMAQHGCPVSPSFRQSRLMLGDNFQGTLDPHPLRAILATEGDLLVFKPGTDAPSEAPLPLRADALTPTGLPGPPSGLSTRPSDFTALAPAVVPSLAGILIPPKPLPAFHSMTVLPMAAALRCRKQKSRPLIYPFISLKTPLAAAGSQNLKNRKRSVKPSRTPFKTS